jgi:hypothetical protein
MTAEDRIFNAVAAYPNQQRHVSNLQSVRVQGSSYFSSFLTPSSTTPAFASTFFSLSLFNATDLAAALGVFDQYKIDLVETWLVSKDPNGSGQASVGLLASAVDLDDAALPTSFAAVQSYGSSLTSSGVAAHYHRWQPHAALAAYSGAFTSYANETSPWIDSGSPNVQHYGLKCATMPGLGGTIPYDLIVRLTVTFRGTF